MEEFRWGDWISLTNVLVATVAAIIALSAPWIGWRLTRRSQLEDQKRQTKLGIFGALMGNRHMYQSRETIGALNLIDVAFHDDKHVRRIWREYHAMISNRAFFSSDVGFELQKQKLLELQTEMAQVLGYDIDRFDIERIYSPTWLEDEQQISIAERQARMAALKGNQPPTSGPPANEPPAGGPSPDGPPGSHPGLNSAPYLVRYMGQAGGYRGYGLVQIADGAITGADLAGVRYEGTYKIESGRLRGLAKLYVPPGGSLVTGFTTETASTVEAIIDLPLDFADGRSHIVQVGGQPVQLSFERIRE